jgi:hypothetical protein
VAKVYRILYGGACASGTDHGKLTAHRKPTRSFARAAYNESYGVFEGVGWEGTRVYERHAIVE